MLMQAPARTFSPETDHKAYREALGRFATGVTLITTTLENRSVGIVANSFTSVSLEPPLILWCAAKQSMRYRAFTDAQSFVVNILAEDQKSVCDAFSKESNAFDRFGFTKTENGVPYLLNAIARFECETYTTHDAGDHAIIVGRVKTACESGIKNPLVFADGKFSGLI